MAGARERHVIGYTLFVLLGIVAAVVANRWQGDVVALPRRLRTGLALCALGGSVVGAYLLQLPADLLGWHASPPAGLGDAMPLGGRTVVGGLLGGWVAVEAGKRLAGVVTSTGAAFALPLALALGFGRLGCAVAGCCAGVECEDHWWALADAEGVPRVPVQLLESAFHFAAAGVFALALRRRKLLGGPAPPDRGTSLAGYLALYAILRFLLEFVRLHPPIALGLTWHQLLALALLGLTGGAYLRRAARGAGAVRGQAPPVL